MLGVHVAQDRGCLRNEVAEPVPMPLKIYMADKAPLWAKMVEKYGLKLISYDQLVNWAFGDFLKPSAKLSSFAGR